MKAIHSICVDRISTSVSEWSRVDTLDQYFISNHVVCLRAAVVRSVEKHLNLNQILNTLIRLEYIDLVIMEADELCKTYTTNGCN